MRYQTHISLILAVQSVVICQVEKATCPSGEQISTQVSSCLTGFNQISGNLSQGTLTGAAVEEYCTTMADAEVRCVEGIYTACRANSTTRRMFDTILNYNATRDAIRRTCPNTDKITTGQRCLAHHKEELDSCLRDELLIHNQKLLELFTSNVSTGEKEFADQSYKLRCLYAEKSRECLESYRRYCGEATGNFHAALIEGVYPPAGCSTNTARPDPSRLDPSSPNSSSASPHRTTNGINMVAFLVLVGLFVNGMW